MRELVLRVVLGGAVLTGWCGWGQTHKVTKPESVVRAVGVYEWTGDLAKPKASRLIPVSLFIDGHLEDAGVYMARPIPFALTPGNLYELQDAGVAKGSLDLVYARHVQTEDAAYDDGWFGFGSYKAPAAVRKPVALKPSKTLPVIASSSDSSKPHFATKGGDSASAGGGDQGKSTSAQTDSGAGSGSGGSAGSAAADDPDRPVMKRRDSGSSGSSGSSSGAAGGTSTGSTGSVPADDPDRPVLKKKSSDSAADSTDGSTNTTGSSASNTTSNTTGSTTGSSAGSTTQSSTDDTSSTTRSESSAADDPDRPTLKRHSVEDAKKAKKNSDVATVTGVGTLNDDPDRPNLHRGKPVSEMTEADLPKLTGLPTDLHQMVAVSDAANRSPHEFALAWDDPAAKAAVLAKMQGMARAQLAAYGSGSKATTPAAASTSAAAKAAAAKTAASKTRRAAAPPPPVPLLDEELKAYTLSYGGAATYVYTALTAGTGADLKYVTVVAQDDGLGEVKPALQSVTDAMHLDRTPRMRLVDVVDVEASNRASLLFELRGQNSRQFALYRVIAVKPEQIFLTGTTQ